MRVQHEANVEVERMDMAEETVAMEGTALVEATGPIEHSGRLLRRWLASQEAWLDLSLR